jgi:predicted DNA-binding transcriptional regulator AlpA
MQEQSGSTTHEAPYLTESQFCDSYKIAPRTAQRWRVTGEGPPWVRMGPRRVVYRLSDCEAWAAARTFAHRAAEVQGFTLGELARPALA